MNMVLTVLIESNVTSLTSAFWSDFCHQVIHSDMLKAFLFDDI